MKIFKRITALICVAALVFTSTGVGTFGYASEKQDEEIIKIASVEKSEVFNPRDLEIYEEGISTFAFNNVYNGSYRSQLSDNEKNYYDQLKAALLTGDDSDPSSIRPREDVADSIDLVEAVDYKLPSYVEYDEDGHGTIYLTEEGTAQRKEIHKEVFYAYFALTHDYPILFWYAGGSANANLDYKGDVTVLEVDYITVTIEEAYPNAKSQIAAFNTGLENVYNLLNTDENTKDEYTTVKVIHDYLCEHITYNHDAVTNAGSDDYKYAHSPGVVFIQENSSVVCEGYGEAFKILCDMFNIPCALVMGTGSGGAHLWNYVQVEGNWYAVDVTWDDQSSIIYNYFMKGSNNFTNHTPENNAFSTDDYYTFAYPVLSEDDYVYVERTSISDMSMTGVVDKVATGEEITQDVKIGDLVLGTDYTLIYKNNVNCGTATVIAKGIGNYNGKITKTFEINHNEVIDTAVTETCTATGLTEGKHCSVCKEVLVAQEEVAALGHKEVVDEAVEPTCETTGLTEGIHCSRCNEVLVVQEEIAALGHTAAAAVVENSIAPTCSKEGSYDSVVYCAVENCGKELSREAKVYAKLPHTEVVDAAVASTCTATGLTEGKHCSTCNEVLVAPEEVAALGHDKVVDLAVEATCTETGLTEGEHCTRCDYKVVQNTVPAKGHKEVIDTAVEATCEATGLTEGKHCSTCNEVLVAQEEVAALGHKEIVDAAVEATCEATGLTEGKHCSVCNKVTVAQEKTEALGHKEVIDAAVDATCTETGLTEGKHCSTCNEVLVAQKEIAALGHKEVIDAAVEAKCEASGLTEGKHCSTCNEVLVAQEEVAALGHKEIVDAAVEATCEATGLTEGKHCSVCNKVTVAQEKTEALGHKEVIDAAVEATCESIGLTEGKHCSVCNKVTVEQEEISALGHTAGTAVVENSVSPTCSKEGSYDSVIYCVVENCGKELSREAKVYAKLPHTEVVDAAVASTCTATGLTEGKHCSTCNEVLVAQEEVAALGHDIVVDAAVEATCTATGLTEGEHCTRCDYKVDQNTVPAKGHKEVIDAAVEATCEATGLTEGKHCSTCNEILVAQEEIAALGHTEADAIVENSVAATCYKEGSYDLVIYCEECKSELSREAKIYDKLAHTPNEAVIENKIAATCTVDGSYDTVVYCEVCKAELERIKTTVPKTGHKEVVDEAVASTCIENGLTEGKHCSTCNEVLVAQEEVSALGHKEVVDAAVEATCETTGLTEGKHCSVCNNVTVAQEEISALGHTAATAVVENSVSPTCSKEGSYDSVVYCAVENCGKELSREAKVYAKLPHTEVVDAAVAATCTETGLTEGKHCSTCNEVLIAQEEVAALGHDKVIDAAVEATCTATGLTEGEHCTRCDYKVDQNTVPAKGHKEVIDAAVEATCDATGLTEGKHCSICNEILVAQEEIAALGHTEADAIIENSVEATCYKEGSYESVVYCEVCKAELERIKTTVPKTGHKEVVDEAVASTCTENGLTEGKHCSTCKEVLVAQEEILALGHNEVIDEAVDATCTATGLTEGKHCSICKEVIIAQEDVAAYGHTKVIYTGKAATCTETGLTDKETCSRCGEVLKSQEVIPVLGHKETTDKAVAPTCTEAGLTEGKHCSRCDEVLVAQEEVAALGHTEVVDAAVSSTCTATGLTDGKHCSRCDEVLVAQEEVAALGHTEVVDKAVAPTCTETGLTEGKHCSVCNKVLIAQKKVAAGHKNGESVVENVVEATCYREGSYDTVVYCEVCDEELAREIIETEKLDHTQAKAVTENKVAATDTTDGSYDTVVYCSEAKCKAELNRETTTVPKASSLKLSTVKYVYNNTVKKPAVTVKDAQGTILVEGTDYDLVYASGRKNVGKYPVTINFKGNYSGSKTLYFTIVPKAPATAKSNLYGYDDIKFSWAKSTGASGYNVYFKKASASKYTFLKETTSNYIKKANLEDGVKYNFKVVPYFRDANGKKYFNSNQNRIASVFTLKKLNIPVVTKSNSKVKVKWNNINGETGYQISKATTKTGTNIVATYKSATGTYKLVNATKGKTYYYKVRAYKVIGKTSAGKDIRVYAPWSKVKTFKR